MSESSNDLPDLNGEITVPIAMVEPVIEAKPMLLGGPPPPDVQAAAARRLSPELQTEAANAFKDAVPSRLNDMENLLDPHGVRSSKLTLPGYDGAPFKGTAIPHLKEDDPQYKKPQVGLEPHVYILDLSKPEDLKDYEGVMTLVAHGYAVISAEERVYDKDVKNWRVFLRWAATISFMPKTN